MNIKVLVFGSSVYHMVLYTPEELKKRDRDTESLKIDMKQRTWEFWGVEKEFGQTNSFSYKGQPVICVFDLDHPGDAQRLVDVVTEYYRDRGR